MVLLFVHIIECMCVSGSYQKSPGLVIVLSIPAEWLIMGVAEITVARPLFLCDYSLSLHFSSARLIFFPRIFLPPSPPSRQALLCLGDLYSRSINLKERERDVGTWQFMGDWHGACSDVTRTGGVTLSVVMSTEETPAHAGTDTNAMEGCAIVTFFMRNKHGLSGTLCHACD